MSFNPRTREGCDENRDCGEQVLTSFNPRTREGCDLARAVAHRALGVVSIHAPARGATTKWRCKSSRR